MLYTYKKGMTKHEKVEELVARDEILTRVKRELEKAQESIKWYYNSIWREVSFELGDMSTSSSSLTDRRHCREN